MMTTNEKQTYLDDTTKASLVKSLAESVPTTSDRFASNRKIAAALFKPDGTCFAAATNTNQTNRLKHAEWNLMLHATAKLGGKIPHNWVIASSLSPCSMCGEVIAQVCEDGSKQRVIFVEADVGKLGKNLSLSQMQKVLV